MDECVEKEADMINALLSCLPIERACGWMHERNVCQGVILEKVVDLTFNLCQLVAVSLEGGLETSWDHLDVDGIPENTFLSILKQNRVFTFFCFRHLVIEW